MSSSLTIEREDDQWIVVDVSDFVHGSFDTLHEAEQFVMGITTCAGRLAVAHTPTPMVGRRCPVCGEVES